MGRRAGNPVQKRKRSLRHVQSNPRQFVFTETELNASSCQWQVRCARVVEPHLAKTAISVASRRLRARELAVSIPAFIDSPLCDLLSRRHMRHARVNRLAILNIDSRCIVFLAIHRLGKGLKPQGRSGSCVSSFAIVLSFYLRTTRLEARHAQPRHSPRQFQGCREPLRRAPLPPRS